jgi:hypothetical protein
MISTRGADLEAARHVTLNPPPEIHDPSFIVAKKERTIRFELRVQYVYTAIFVY